MEHRKRQITAVKEKVISMKALKSNSVFARHKRLLSFFICVAVLLGGTFVYPVFASSGEISVTIEQDGMPVQKLGLPENERKELTALCNIKSDQTRYQWQILSDPKSDTWVNIFDGTADRLTVSYALIQSLLDSSGSTYIRCSASLNGEQGYSSPVCVTVEYMPSFEGSTATLSSQVNATQNEDIPITAQENGDEYWVDITINYLDGVSDLPIYSSYTGRVNVSEKNYEATVISPTYLGYAPYYNSKSPSDALPDGSGKDYSDLFPDSANTIRLNITADTPHEYVINVYYFAINVPYAVRYYFQDIHDDQYTENVGLYRTDTAKTGTIISGEKLEENLDSSVIDGFTKLYHYPEAVSADGSTVFECYYDRKYFMLNFDANGGYGSEPIYARYETPFLVNSPTRHGYEFCGWDLIDKDGNGDGISDQIPSAVPNESRTYKAIWKRSDTTYHIAYWLENADNDSFAYIGTVKSNAKSGDIITSDYIKENYPLNDTTPICGDSSHFDLNGNHIDDGSIETGDCYFDETKYILYDDKSNQGTEVTVSGDGSTVINIYYTRRYYTLRFFYAKEYNGAEDNNPNRDPNNTFTGIRYSVVGGSTYGFGNMSKDQSLGFFNSKNDYTLDDLFLWLQEFEGSSTKLHDKWGMIDADAPPAVRDPENAHYETGVYPAEGEGYNNGNYDIYGDRYHYFDLTAKYGADLTELWPVDVFGRLKVQDPQKHTSNGAHNELDDDGWGNYAYASGWNGEYKVQYSIDNSNTTIKGLYQKLNKNLLFGATADKEFEYDDSRKIVAKSTVGGKEVDSNVCYFINFFDNGANISWSIPREWIYECYVPVFENEVPEGSELYNAIAAASNNQNGTYKYQSYTWKTEPDPRTYTDPESGNTYYLYNGQIYRLYNKNVTNDDNIIFKNGLNGQTPTALHGFTYSGVCEQISNQKTDDRRLSFTSRFFYTRNSYTLTLHSHNSVWKSNTNQPFDSLLNQIMLEDGKLISPPYPNTLEENAYEFDDWYQSPECIDGTEYDPDSNPKMPGDNVALYAKWKPKVHTVRLFQTYGDMLRYESDGDLSGLIGEPIKVSHGLVIDSIKNPTDKSEFNYTFGGWFYMKAGKKTAYTPLDSPVLGDMNVFADWGSMTAQPYLLHFALFEPERDTAWISLINDAVASEIPKNNASYTVSDGKSERTYIYLESDGGYHLTIASDSNGFAYQGSTRTFTPKVGNPYGQLYDGYNQGGYYPTLASHSITMEFEENKLKPEKNVFTFTYVYKKDVEYRVEYRYADTNQLIPEDMGGGVKYAVTSDAVVTERFKTVTGYVPDAFFKRLILAVVEDENGDFVSADSNLIVFYYSKNTENAYYAVHYMLQNPGAGTGLDRDEKGNFLNYTESSAHTEGIGTVGGICQIPPQSFSGFEVSRTGWVSGDKQLSEGEIALLNPDGDNPYFEITVSEDGTELYIFYTRTKHKYTVYYLDYGTDISNMPLDKNAKGVLEIEEPGLAEFGQTVTVSAASKSFAGRTCISPLTQSLLIRAKDEQNYIIFYYTPMQQTIEYKVWKYGGGTLDTTLEVFEGAPEDTKIKGSTATALNGYEFSGWYLDESCTIPVSESKGHITGSYLLPYGSGLEAMPKINTFYAKFTSISQSLTIIRENGENDQSNGTQTFVYKITAKNDPDYVIYASIVGNGSVTIKDIPCREYTIEQQNGWSWRYDDRSVDITVEQDKENSVTFGADAVWQNRLNGNSQRITNRKR